MRRVLVVGVTGAGKSTAAAAIAQRLRLPFHELDALAFGPGWTRPPDFVARVTALVEEPGWVVDSWGYPEVRDLLWAAADSLVWLDFPRRVVLPRVVRRSVHRSAGGAEIFGGNRETWRGWLSLDHPVWWSMRTFRSRRRDIGARLELTNGVSVTRLTSPAELESWLARLPA